MPIKNSEQINDFLKTTNRLENLMGDLADDEAFLYEENAKWNNYISFNEIKLGRVNWQKYGKVKYASESARKGIRKERTSVSYNVKETYKHVKSAERFLRKIENLGYNEVPRFRKLSKKLENYLTKIKSRKYLTAKQLKEGAYTDGK